MASNLFPVLVAPRWVQRFAPAVSTPLLLTLGGGATPLSTSDTALPALRVFPVSLRTWTGSTNLLLGKDAVPPGGYAQISELPPRAPPRLQQTWTQMDLLLGKDTMLPGLPARVVEPPPARFVPPRLEQTWTQMDRLLGLDTLLPGGPARIVDLPPRAPPRLEQTWWSVPLLLGQDAMPPGGANVADDLAPSRLAPYRIQQTWTLGPLLLGQDAMLPGLPARADMPPPSQFVPWRMPQSWATAVLLLGKDTMLPGGPQRIDALPARAYRLEQTWFQNLLESTFGVLPMPFATNDWLVPTQAPYNVTLRTWAPTGPSLLGKDVFPPALPGAAGELAPRAAARAEALLRTWASSPSLLGQDQFPPGLPAQQSDLAPRGAARLQQIWSSSPVLLGQDQFPPGMPNQAVDPAPAWLVRFRMLQDWQMNFFVAPAGAPFLNYDWPLPMRAAPLVQTWLQSPNLLGKDTMLPGGAATVVDSPPARFIQYRVHQTWTQANYLLGSDTMPPGGAARADAPVPTARVRIEQTWTQVLLETTLQIVSPPPANYDWPLPVRAPLQVPTWASVPLLLGQDQFPPALPRAAHDPVPRAPARAEQSWTQNLLEASLGVLPMPFAMYDWQVPVRAAPLVRTWSQGPSLLGKDVFPPGLPRRADDPVPTRAPLLVKTWAQIPLMFGPPPVALLPTERIFVDYSEGRVRMSYSEGRARMTYSEGHVRVSNAEGTVRAVFEQGTIRVTLERL